MAKLNKMLGMIPSPETILGSSQQSTHYIEGQDPEKYDNDFARIIGAGRQAEENKLRAKARAKIKPIPNPGADKSNRRQSAARRRGGRVSTILSETLG